MPPLNPLASRLVIYYQTHHDADGNPCSILPLITQSNISITHLIIAAIHLNEIPEKLSLNDHHPSHIRNRILWDEIRKIQLSGIKVLGMLGGAAKGSFSRLDLQEETFEIYYKQLRNFVRERNLDGLDLDVEENMSFYGIVRLISRLKQDFGEDFLITLAPVAAALISDDPKHNLSGFSYRALEEILGRQIAWYNTQFYCGWGDMSSTKDVDQIIDRGYPPNKIVVGLVTNPENGKGWVPFDILQEQFKLLKYKHKNFGGVMGWEYFNSLPGGESRPWEWATIMTQYIRSGLSIPSEFHGSALYESSVQNLLDEDNQNQDTEAPVPVAFDYFSDIDV